MDGTRTVAVDCRMLGSSGVGVYLRGVLPYLIDSARDFLLLGDTERLVSFTAGRKNAKILPCRIRPFSLREMLCFPRRLLKEINGAQFYYTPYFNIPGGLRVPVFTTIHDIVFPDMPQLTSRLGLAARLWFYRRAFRRSQTIFTVSEFSAGRIRHYAGEHVPLKVTYNGLLPIFTPPSPVQNTKTRSIIFVGNIKKHKGLACLLEAFAIARERGLDAKLIIAGERENFRSSDTDLRRERGVRFVEFTGRVSDERLRTLLAQSTLLVQPSLYEGFGLPPLEAMSCGTRALVSDIPVFQEIYAGFPVTFFRAGDAADLADKLLKLLRSREPETISLSPELLSRYTFEKTADHILEVFDEFDKRPRRRTGKERVL